MCFIVEIPFGGIDSDIVSWNLESKYNEIIISNNDLIELLDSICCNNYYFALNLLKYDTLDKRWWRDKVMIIFEVKNDTFPSTNGTTSK